MMGYRIKCRLSKPQDSGRITSKALPAMLKKRNHFLPGARCMVVAFACAWLVVVFGRPRSPTPSPYDLGRFDQEFYAWPDAEKQGAVPGIDQGSCLRVRNRETNGFVVVWTDFRWGPESRGGRMNGVLAQGKKEGEEEVVCWEWKADGGKTGTLVINDEPYILDKGSLFLVSTKDGKTRVKQFDKDLSALKDTPSDRFLESLQDLAKSDKDIGGFFVDAAKRN